MSNIVLKTEGLTKRYGELVAVDDLTLEVYRGEVFGFLGPNGAGKTTSINMMCGLLEPDTGTVTIDGVPVHAADDELRARVGVCPQEIVLWERLTCLEQLQFMGEMYGLSRSDARERSEMLLEELDLVDKRDEQARKLSGGLQRRLNVAMALVHDPEIVILDEPEVGLDPQSRVKVREYIQSLAQEKTVILTTHNMDEADRLANRVAIIDHGKLLELDTPTVLKKRVGEGDVVEIELESALDPVIAGQVEAAVLPLVDQVHMDHETSTLTVRALNAVGALASILDALEKSGVQAGEVRVRENTLEDVFIQLTGRRLRQ
ncbi:MAG TPA: ABC transporter ATP-binding protein [Anaerolineae bacterium]|nr:ABC transporter ATP-binding protein [Anaerolineae bacterium]